MRVNKMILGDTEKQSFCLTKHSNFRHCFRYAISTPHVITIGSNQTTCGNRHEELELVLVT